MQNKGQKEKVKSRNKRNPHLLLMNIKVSESAANYMSVLAPLPPASAQVLA
ncbi:hypothetical protein [Lysinibacillus fusiformis]|uniref:hypothetical protein n=1 Tax=Lysinibacillus fusiformis TaxID=28031 RepID=UPI00215B6D65|nr:hypothetical protein [Lysinibacillus fusiformis]MCR8853516.1 hypothetical protein [Lysinibacillus fusiformis]